MGKKTVKSDRYEEGFWNERTHRDLADIQNEIIEHDRNEKAKRQTKRPQ